jgi:hypothetical protein
MRNKVVYPGFAPRSQEDVFRTPGPFLLFFIGLPLCAQITDDGARPADNKARPSIAVRILRPFRTPTPGRITERERIREYLISVAGPGRILASAASAGLSQAAGGPLEWEQGASGYFKRFGGSMGYFGVRETIAYALPVPLREDNRHFASGKTEVWARVGHAASGGVLARHPDGRVRLSFSTLAGVTGGAVISRMWAPPSRAGGSYVVRTEAFGLAASAAFNIFREFTPDLIRKLERSKK